MSARRHALDAYLALRHAMGVKLREAPTLVPHFIALLAQPQATFLTTERAVPWAPQPRHGQPAAWASRLRLVRGFAQDPTAMEPRTESPPPQLLP